MFNSKFLIKNYRWGILTVVAVAIALIAVAPYMSLNSANFNNATARYVNETPIKYVGLFVHALSSGIALVLGPFQFLREFRNRYPVVHRWIGRIYLVAILFGGISGLVIAPGIISGLVGEVGLSLLAILWLFTAYMAFRTIKNHQVELHRQWMIRNYALTFAAATLRIWLGLLTVSQIPSLQTKYGGDFNLLFVEVYRVVMWLCWVPNLVVAEWMINRLRVSKPSVLSAV